VTRPVPAPDERSAPFWAAAAEHRLVLARCSRCGRLSHPPDLVCARCRHPDPAFAFVPVDGTGTMQSWITVHQSFLPGFDELLPFVLVDVALDEDPEIRLIGRLLDGPSASTNLVVGRRVRVDFEDLGPGVAVPAFVVDAQS
jgi:uncharacterized OB-fold protein